MSDLSLEMILIGTNKDEDKVDDYFLFALNSIGLHTGATPGDRLLVFRLGDEFVASVIVRPYYNHGIKNPFTLVIDTRFSDKLGDDPQKVKTRMLVLLYEEERSCVFMTNDEYRYEESTYLDLGLTYQRTWGVSSPLLKPSTVGRWYAKVGGNENIFDDLGQ